jgi:two-component system, cell cycle sensor histidine kinase and response regulator CckA
MAEEARGGVGASDFPHAIWRLIEDAPVRAFLFRAVPGDFVLERVNAIAGQESPVLLNMIGRPCSLLYRDQPEINEAAFRCMNERRTVVQQVQVRKVGQVEATGTQKLVYVCHEPDWLVIYAQHTSGSEGLAAALQESEARYRSVVASLPDAVLLRGSDSRALTCNESAARLFGHASLGEVLGQVHVLAEGYGVETEDGVPVSPADYPSRRVLRTGVPVIGELFKLRRPDGSQVFLRVSAQPIHARSGAIGGSVTLYTDITDRRRLEDELRQAQRLESIGRLAGGLAHDFNNLLTAMLGSLELLVDACPQAAMADLTTIRHGAERARELTGQLLAFARKQPIELDVVDVGALVAKVERLLARLVGPNVELVIAAGQGLCVRADAAQLEQVLVNLVANARDAMPSGGRIDVRVAALRDGDDREWIQIEVADQGVGIEPETLRQVFDPFFTTKAHGTGLGLASCYGVIKQHGGDIGVESEVGRGACFRVSLPRVGARVAPVLATPAVLAGTGRVLVVDDDDAVRNTTGRMLKSMGYDVLLASDARSAVDLARQHSAAIDVLLCDIAMPGRSGPEVAREVLEVSPDTRVLFISGYQQGGDASLARHSFLQKPFTRAALGAKLRALSKPAAVLGAGGRS